MFWRVLFSFNKSQLFKFIKFISRKYIWPLYITSHQNPSQMIQNAYSNYIQLDSTNNNNSKGLPITQINLSSDILYEIEYINYLIKSYHLYGSMMHNNYNNYSSQQIHFLTSLEQTHLWIVDECRITCCNQTTNMKQSPNLYLPEVHTCTCSIRLPSYTCTEKQIKAKLIKAMDFCNTFDSFTNKGNIDFQLLNSAKTES